MAQFHVHLKQKEKATLPLSRLKDEINDMYAHTIANSSRTDLGFFVLAAFLSLRKGKKSLLRELLETNLPKLRTFTMRIASLKRYLKKDEYAELKEKMGLTNVLANDVFFLLLRMIGAADEVLSRFSSFFEYHPDLATELKELTRDFGDEIDKFHFVFESSRIRDDRVDPDTGNQLDLSKSIYRTIGMRLSRKLDFALQEETEVVELRRNSPIDLAFLQYVTPELLYNLWESFHLGEYLVGLFSGPRETLEFVKNHFAFEVNLGDGLNVVFYHWLLSQIKGLGRGNKDRKAAKTELKTSKEVDVNKRDVNELLQTLVRSILRAPETLKLEIKRVEEQLTKLREERHLTKKEVKAKRNLEHELKKLKNIVVEIEKTGNSNVKK
jgi:hypothetical protein